MLDFTSIERLRTAGFEGFVSISELRRSRLTDVPDEQGVYLVLANEGLTPDFLDIGTGGHFKKSDPNVSISELKSNWVADAIVVNIGKAGGTGVNSTLRSRLRLYLKFGEGKPVGHRGGRYIWQLRSADQLSVCWMVTAAEPRDVERQLIAEFCQRYGMRPFANLQD